MPNKRLTGLQTFSKIGCSALCLFWSANVYCLYCCYGNEHGIVLDFYFDIIQMFVSWEWQQLLSRNIVMLCYAKHVVRTVHRLYLPTTKCTCWYYKRTTIKICLSDVLPAFLPFSFYADQSVLLSLLIYFIRIGVYVVQFQDRKSTRLNSSHT